MLSILPGNKHVKAHLVYRVTLSACVPSLRPLVPDFGEMCVSVFVKCFPPLVVLHSSYLLGPGCVSINSRHSSERIVSVFAVAPCRAGGEKAMLWEGSNAKACAAVRSENPIPILPRQVQMEAFCVTPSHLCGIRTGEGDPCDHLSRRCPSNYPDKPISATGNVLAGSPTAVSPTEMPGSLGFSHHST